MAIEVFSRFEHKYMMDGETYEKVLAVALADTTEKTQIMQKTEII